MNIVAPTHVAGPGRLLRPKETDVWCVDLDTAPGFAEVRAILSADEIVRAERFCFPMHRERFAAARATLRIVLASYLEVEPEALKFSYGEFGKPLLSGNPLHFNLSHSESVLLIAVAQSEVGIDVEKVNAQCDFAGIAEMHFPPDEASSLRVAPPSERATRFYKFWTAKEAILKARGLGIANGIGSTVESPGNWSVCEIAAPTDYVAALAINGCTPKINRCAAPDYSIYSRLP